MRLSLLTPTADQPTGIALCERYMTRQTVPVAGLEWIVVDDGEIPATLTMGQRHVLRPRPPGTPGFESFCRNLLLGLEHVTGDAVVFVEHDDWYRPDHLETLLPALERGALLVGDDRQNYYNVSRRVWRSFANFGASMCQTAIARGAIPVLERTLRLCLSRKTYGVDTTLWRAIPRPRWGITKESSVLGIKGLPGRPGLGIGHRPAGDTWNEDPRLDKLRGWIGEDAEIYAGFGGSR